MTDIVEYRGRMPYRCIVETRDAETGRKALWSARRRDELYVHIVEGRDSMKYIIESGDRMDYIVENRNRM
jgi:hypothetical protein